MTHSSLPIEAVFDQLWADYIQFNPQAKRIYDLILERERAHDPSLESLVNDHVALRTYNIPHIGLEAMAHLFLRHGYKKGGEYEFKEKKLRAWHFEHENDRLPKVFISELETEKLSSLVQETAKAAAQVIEPEEVKNESILWSRRKWTAEHSTYQKLLAESEYAAWLYAFGFRSNHFTISLNHLKSFKDLTELNQFILSNGYQLNTSGGVIKGTPDQFLEQSSTLAENSVIEFTDGKHQIPACYYEFARRYPMPNGKLYQGFVATSADKIFESTNVRR